MLPATILITGFGPFPDVPVNASATLARRLAGAARRRFPPARVVSCVLPTEWVAAPSRLAALYAHHEPRISLHFGVSAHARGLEIERIAANRCLVRHDATGSLPAAEHIDAGGPAALPAPFPVAAVLQRLAELGIPATPSDDAGSYLCNAVLYHSACHAGRRARAVAGFVHVPTILPAARVGGTRELTMPEAITGGLAILDVCLGTLRSPAAPEISAPDRTAR